MRTYFAALAAVLSMHVVAAQQTWRPDGRADAELSRTSRNWCDSIRPIRRGERPAVDYLKKVSRARALKQEFALGRIVESRRALERNGKKRPILIVATRTP
jgi:hypothetical protein